MSLLHSDNQNDVELGCRLTRRCRDAYLVWKSGLENAIILYSRQGELKKRSRRTLEGGGGKIKKGNA